MMEPALPFARGRHLFILKLFPTKASFTKSLSISNCLLFSALAIAAFKTYNIVLDTLFEENFN